MSGEKQKYFQVLKKNPKVGDGTFPPGELPLPGGSMIDHYKYSERAEPATQPF